MGDLSKIKVLVVDDTLMMRKVAREMLISLGVSPENIDLAEDGKIALKKLTDNIANKTPQFEMVFLDWSMPEIDGYTLLQQCRGQKEFNNIAFVMMTAESEKSEIIKAIQAGATSYIEKPYTRAGFQEKITMVAEWLDGKKS